MSLLNFLKLVKKHLPVGVIPIITVRNAFQVFGIRPLAHGIRVAIVSYQRWTSDVRCFHLKLDTEGKMQDVKEKKGGCAKSYQLRRPA